MIRTTTALPEDLVGDVAPPSEDRPWSLVRDVLTLVPQLVWHSLLVVVDVAVAVYTLVFPPPAKNLAGNVVLVTGAGRGLGRGLALGFAREGCKVAVVDINMTTASSTAADIVAAGGVAKAYSCNVADPDDVTALRRSVTSDLGDVDVLVNNAGLVYGGDKLEDCPVDNARAVIDVNLSSHFWMLKEFLPGMKSRNSGHVVAIASATSFGGIEKAAAYVASKFGLRGLMEVVRLELNLNPNNKVQTTTVYPYFINTSADYVSQWKIRLPPISIEDVVEATISGVKANSISVFAPRCLHLALYLKQLIPPKSFERFMSILIFGMLPKNNGCSEKTRQL